MGNEPKERKTTTMNQTAVEFLFEKLWNTPIDKLTWHAILEQAKAIEKEQIIDAHINGYDSSGSSAEEYYKEKFNK